MKLKILGLLFSVMLGMHLIQACCESTYQITTGGELTAYLLKDSMQIETDTITGTFLLVGGFSLTNVAQTMDIAASAYATSCATHYVNALEAGSIVLTWNKSFIYQGDTITPGADLLKLSGIESYIGDQQGYLEATFTKEFFSEAQLEEGLYEFTLTGTTTDDLFLEAKREIYLKP